jgi:SAM-dependent methyltransferase
MSVSKHPPICDYEGSDYQQVFWEKGGREYEDQVEAIALRRLLPKSGKMLLEAGAGAGRNSPRYQGFEKVYLFDYSLTQLYLAKEYLAGSDRYHFVAADIYRLPFIPGSFDTATMIRVLHHMADAPRALDQMRQVLVPGGIFILEYANKKNLKALLRYALGRQKWSPYSLAPVEFAPLNFDFHPRKIRNWLDRSGFLIERQLTVSHYRIGLLKHLIPTPVLVALDALVQPTGGLLQLTPSVFVRAQATGEPPENTTSSIFRCPSCGSYPLDELPDGLMCPSCSRRWGARDGIYDFRQPIG